MLKIKTWRDPYNEGFSITRPKEITLEEGLTVLVGCNGAGKTTMLMNIREQCKTETIPILYYDNLKEGGDNALESSVFNENFGLTNNLYSASEGEAIKINFGRVMKKTRKFLNTGVYDILDKNLFSSTEGKKEITDNRRVLLFDAIDSGLSVDSVTEIRHVFNLILKDAQTIGVEIYIIVSANVYELARKAPCFDVVTGKYKEFNDYEAYRTFILQSRERKEKRNDAGKRAVEKR